MNHQAERFFDRLAAKRDILSPKMLSVAHFMEANYLDAAFMSTRELADAAGVSLATVVRFPRVLGYSDFDALREAIQTQVNIELTGVERLKTLPKKNISPGTLLRRVVEEDIETLRALEHDFSESQAEIFVDALAAAEHITVLGFRYVAPLALYCSYSLNKIRGGVEVHTRADSSLYDHMRSLGESDLIVAIGFARYPADLMDMLHYAHQLGLRIVCITDSTLSPLIPLAAVSLFAKGTIRDFVGSLSAPGALINGLVSELGRRLGNPALERLAAAEQAAQANGIYVDGFERSGTNRGWRGTLLHEAESLEAGCDSM